MGCEASPMVHTACPHPTSSSVADDTHDVGVPSNVCLWDWLTRGCRNKSERTVMGEGVVEIRRILGVMRSPNPSERLSGTSQSFRGKRLVSGTTWGQPREQ